MQLEEFLGHVQRHRGYSGLGSAAQATQKVLEVLGSHLVGDDLTHLAAILPVQCAPVLDAATPASEPLTPADFVAEVAARTHGDAATARRHTTAVLHTVALVASEALVARLVTQLPPGYGPLFGRSEPDAATSTRPRPRSRISTRVAARKSASPVEGVNNLMGPRGRTRHHHVFSLPNGFALLCGSVNIGR